MQTTDFAAFGGAAGCAISGVADAQGVYKANCTKTGQTVAKESTFFPDGWDIARIRDEVAYAYCHPVATLPGVAWCGSARTAGVIIGGRGPQNAIATAFPAYGGAFV